MSRNDGDTGTGLPVLGDSEGKKRTLVSATIIVALARVLNLAMRVRDHKPSEVVLATGLQALLPIVMLPDLTRSSDASSFAPSPETYTFWNPAFSRRALAACTAWKGVGEAFTKSRSL